MGKFSEEEVKVKNDFFDRMGAAFQTIGKHKWDGDKGKDSYWVFKYKDKLEQASKPYFEAKKEAVEWVAQKNDKGEPVRAGTGYQPDMTKVSEYEAQIEAINEIEVSVGIKKRFFDPKSKTFSDLSPDEWAVIMPFLANPDEIEAEMMLDGTGKDD